MKNLLKKLHIGSNQSDDSEGSISLKGSKTANVSSPDRVQSRSNHGSENKPFSALSGWLNSVTHKNSPSPPSASNAQRGARLEQSDSASSNEPLEAVLEAVRVDSNSNNSRDPDIEEEYQIQLALELSAREDPEAVQIEAVKQISLGSCQPENTPAEVVAYRYWNYNALSYDDKILDGFYDVYGILTESTSSMMPSLIDLQGAPVSDIITWEAVLVNRAADANLLNLEQKALEIAVRSRAESLNVVRGNVVGELAALVSDHMGGPVADPDKMSRAWKSLSITLKSKVGSMVLPLGSLTVGLARHRALLFKVLADSVGIPCRLVKGRQFTGSHDAAMNFVKIDDGREYIVDLMAAPGTLIPSDVAGLYRNSEEAFLSSSLHPGQSDISLIASSSGGLSHLLEEHSGLSRDENATEPVTAENEPTNPDMLRSSSEPKKEMICEVPARPNYPNMHARSPSWTEGVSSPAARKMKVKDVSQYMIDAAKENPQLAQKLHDVLLESGVVAPPNLFTEVYSEQLDNSVQVKRREVTRKIKPQNDLSRVRYLPPLPQKHMENRVDERETSGQAEYEKKIVPVNAAANVPVSAAAVAAAAVVASSMVVAAKNTVGNTNLELPVAAATAVAVVATSAVVNKQELRNYEPLGNGDMDDSSHGANTEGERTSDRSIDNDSTKSDMTLDDVADCEIQWEEITVGERIGLGSYGEVYRGDWHGTEVAIKKFLDQDITAEFLEEFRSEIRIMKRLRHPNVVLFMGAITRAPNLSIVTEFLPRGSLYRLLHRPNNQLDERRRLRMALDAARGMNYLHNCTPVVVHRDLKSPNLLVDKNWVVKVCDFGLSRMKHSTFLSSRSTAGTAEWMAPEVLRNEPSNEKCDVFSFGVILWELCTMKQPWNGMNPMQVVGAVGFQHRRLDIPADMDPAIADIILKCWETDPKLRPSFSEIMAALKPLQKPINATQSQRPTNSGQKGRSQDETSQKSR